MRHSGTSEWNNRLCCSVGRGSEDPNLPSDPVSVFLQQRYELKKCGWNRLDPLFGPPEHLTGHMTDLFEVGFHRRGLKQQKQFKFSEIVPILSDRSVLLCDANTVHLSR